MRKTNTQCDCSVSKCNNLTCYNGDPLPRPTPMSMDSFITSRSWKFLPNSNECLLYMQELLGVNWANWANTHPHSDRYSTVCLYNTLCIIMCYLGGADVGSPFSRFSWILLAKRTSHWGCLHLPFCSLCQPFYHPPLTQILLSVWSVLSTESI